ncbi:MAG TPA: response regulator transcription factor [Candidatus Polarisedimenticolia bacterium]|nr:response regulator transcription factor [Candidatus Polarisedimenticolia bacterium]
MTDVTRDGNRGTRRTRILCVDDHVEIRRLFELVMRDNPEFEVVGTSEGAEELEARVEELSPDVVILDLSMYGRDPLDAMRSVKERIPGTRFLVSSSWDDEETIDRAFQAGASGYLVKEGNFDALADAIRRVAKDEKVVPARRTPGSH